METFYSTAELAEYFKISEITIRRYIKLGKIKSVKIGKQHRISESSLKNFIADAAAATLVGRNKNRKDK